jgi:deoxyribodipyrimidine photolyase-related protein
MLATLVFPHQLFARHPAIAADRTVWLVEDALFFGDQRYPAAFHRQKLIMHRASMKRYATEALAGYSVQYVEYQDVHAGMEALFERLGAAGVSALHVADPADFMVEKRLRRCSAAFGIPLVWYETPAFLNTPSAIHAFYDGRKTYFQTDFYIWQRRKHRILLTDDGKPMGGRWTYDTDNRQKLPPSVNVPSVPGVAENAFVHEARDYIETCFPHAPGASRPFIYPTCHSEARAVLQQFVAERLSSFGVFQDAISQRTPFLFHSLLSAPLNCGLLTPDEIIEAVMRAFSHQPALPIASVEGFVRQVIGWREFMRAVYVREGVRQRTANFWGHGGALDERWYTARLGIPPVDDAIRKAQSFAYNHHIERLMVVGNLMLLCEIHPMAVYRWFMEMFIDAYDWVMVPNVYGMSQFADGGLITTKPYLSSSNYIRRMSDYRPGPWCDIWDSLYWRFVDKHRLFFAANPRLNMMVGHLERMGEAAVRAHWQRAERFMNDLA